jgi:hypothetical protein
MVIKANLLHSGWSYSNGDDQYDTESLGSTKKVFTLKKSTKNSSRNRKNNKVGILCSRNKEEHTNEHGWTTIDNNSSRKPKKTNSKQTQIKSIISQIDSPTRKIVCSPPEEIITQEEEEQEQEETKTKEQGKQTVTLPKGEETRIERTAQNTIPGKAETTRHEKEHKNANISKGTRSITRQVEERTNKKQEYERKTKQTTTTTGEENKEASEIEQDINGTPERNQNNGNKEIGRHNNNSNNNNNNGNNGDKNKNNSNNNNNNNNREVLFLKGR